MWQQECSWSMQYNQAQSQNQSDQYENSFYSWYDEERVCVDKICSDILTKPIIVDQYEILTKILLTGHDGIHYEQWVEQVLIVNEDKEFVLVANKKYVGKT